MSDDQGIITTPAGTTHPIRSDALPSFKTFSVSNVATGAGGEALDYDEPLWVGVSIKADTDNTGVVYVGGAGVTAGTADATDGYPLYAGESHVWYVQYANLLRVIASAASQKIYVSCQ